MRKSEKEAYAITPADRLVGLLVVLAAIGVVVALVLRAQEIGPGEKTLGYYTVIGRSFGIVQGGDIRLSGITIGKINQVSLLDDGRVRVDMRISDTYRRFVTAGSYLEIGTSIGLAAVLGSTGLNLVSDRTSTELLEEGSLLDTREPTSLADVLSEDEIGRAADNLKALLENLRSVSDSVAANRQIITEALQSMTTISEGLKHTVDMLPDMVATVNTGFDTWRDAGSQVGNVVRDSGEDIRVVAADARVASGQLKVLLKELTELTRRADDIVANIQLGADELPALISDSHALVRGANEITERVNQHWLLGGERAGSGSPPTYLTHPTGLGFMRPVLRCVRDDPGVYRWVEYADGDWAADSGHSQYGPVPSRMSRR